MPYSPANNCIGASKQNRQSLNAPDKADVRKAALRLSKNTRANGADPVRSLLQLLTTFPPFVALLATMITAFLHGYWWVVVLLAPLAAGLLVRLFIFQHDCGHGSFFQSRSTNDFLGRFLSIFTLTPYGHWKQSHAVHHATSGNLDRRGWGDVPTITVSEYRALSPLNKLGYRLFRNPFIMIFLGAPVNFIVLQRIPFGRGFRERASRRSILGLNLALVAAFGAPMLLIGATPVLSTYLPVMIIAAWIGGWLFYVQHQFEDTYWAIDKDWDFYEASLHGSSYLILPRILQWFTGNIGLHHIHHLNSRIPNYRLQSCLDNAPELAKIARGVTLRDSLKGFRLALWEEKERKLISFQDLGQSKKREKAPLR